MDCKTRTLESTSMIVTSRRLLNQDIDVFYHEVNRHLKSNAINGRRV